MTTNNPSAPKPVKRSIVRFAPLALIALILIGFLVFGLDKYLSLEALRHHRAMLVELVSEHPFKSAAIFVLLYSICTAASVPGASLLTVAGGFLFGTSMGGTLAVISATLGAVGVFLAARSAFGDVLRDRLPGSALERLKEGFSANAFNYLLSLRLIPLFPFWLVNLAPAFLGVGLRTFTLATIIGIIPGTFVYASVGGGLGMTLEMGEEPDFGIIFHPQIITPLIGLAVLALVPILWRRFGNAGR